MRYSRQVIYLVLAQIINLVLIWRLCLRISSVIYHRRRLLHRCFLWSHGRLSTGWSIRLQVTHLSGQIRSRIMMRFKYRWLGRRAAECWINGTLKLGDRIIIVFRCFRCGIVNVSTTEVDVLWRIGDFLASSLFLDEAGNILLNLATLQGQPNFFT